MRFLLEYRFDKLNLFGKHIDVQSGKWQEKNSEIGSNSDSFYEYLIKHYVLHQDEDFCIMFKTAYAGIFYNSSLNDGSKN